MKDIRILLVEDHAVVRAGLRMLVNAEPEMEVIGEAENGLEAVEKALSLHPDVILMDISMQGMNGLEAAKKITAEKSTAKILMLTMHEDEEYFFQALQAGASGYVPKSAPDTEVLAAIRSVSKGHSYLHPSVARLLVNDYLERVRTGEEQKDLEPLSDREREILQMVATGLTNREIGAKLSISVHTVHNHRSRLMEKLGVHDRLELLKYAIRKGILEVE